MYQFPNLKKFKNIVHACLDSSFGNASPIYSSPKKVYRTIKKISSKLNIPPKNLVTVDQIHSNTILPIKTHRKNRQLKTRIRQADGLITSLPNTYLLIKTADCVPIFYFDPKQKVVALIHAGFRGAEQKIHTKAISRFKTHFKSRPQDIIVGLGPAICKNCYRMDLLKTVKNQLIAKGVLKENINLSGICTLEDKNWFSYKRDKKANTPQGRFASIIGIRNET